MARSWLIERWRTLPRSLRWLAIAAAAGVALLLALSVALSVAANRWIRPLVEEQASLAIPGEVRMGGLGISLLGLSVEIDDLAILRASAEGDPAPGGADQAGADAAGAPLSDTAGEGASDAASQPARHATGHPVLEVRRLYASLARLPLLRRRIEVKRIEIDEPVVRVVREENGELDLLGALVPETPPAPVAEAEPAAEDVPVRLRRVDLGAGRIEFTDRAQPGAEPLTIEIPRSQVEDVVVTGAPGDRRSSVHLELSTEGASVELDGSFRRAADVLDVDATADVTKLPLARGRVYLPDIGWSELAGELDAKVHYVHVSGTTQKADGSIELRGLRVGVPTLKEPALAFDSLTVEVDALDLLGRRLALGDVALVRPRLFFDPANRTSLPLLPKGLPGAAPPPPEEPAKPAGAEPAQSPAFAWSLDELSIEEAQLVPIGDGAIPLGLDVSLAAIASDAPNASAVELTLTQADGSLTVEGSACASPPGFRGKVALESLALAPLLRVVAPDAGAQVLGGAADGEIEVRLGSLAAGDTPAPGGDLHLGGTITLEGVDVKTDAGGALDAKLGEVVLALQSVDLPGVLPPPDGAAPSADTGRLRLAGGLRIRGVAARSGDVLTAETKAAELRLDSLELPGLIVPSGGEAPGGAGRLRAAGALAVSGVAVKSGKDGEFGFDLETLDLGLSQIEVPGLLGGAGAKDASEPLRLVLDRARIAGPKLRVTRAESGVVLPSLAAPSPREASSGPAAQKQAVAAKETQPDAAPARSLRIELGALALEGGSVRFVDRTVKPFYQGDVTGIKLDARDVRFPEPRVRDVSLKLDAPGPAPLWALGAYTPESSWYELNLDHLPIAPLNPYVRNASGYIVNGGELSLYSKGSVTEGHLYAANWITLFDPDLSGGGPDAPLEKALGVPVSLAISLLKDPAGDIGLSIPIDYDEKGASVRLGSVIGSAVKGVLIGALTSPLKLLGAVVDASGRVKDVTPEPVHFLPGRTDLAAGDDERVAALAKLAATRPGLSLRLTGQTSGSDAQFLREATLLEAITTGDGLPEPARGITQTLVRRRLGAALEARLAGKPEGLEPEDAQRLDQWLAAVAIGSDAMSDLARRRAARVQELLQTQFGLDAKQIVLADPGPPGTSPFPAVDVAI